jgi:pyrroloquinoline quinone biosynthesis protein B
MEPSVSRPFAMVLGIMQDGGLPHIGCRCPHCAAAFEIPARAQLSASLAIVDDRLDPARVWIIDATPDIGRQLNALAPYLGPHPHRPERLRQPEAIFLTHAHMGHTAGLAQLGPEAMAVSDLPVYASAALVELLRQTALWRPLLAGLLLHTLRPGRPIPLSGDLSLTPTPVPHRDELGTGTFAFRIQGPGCSLLYLPDIDGWQAWPEADQVLSSCDIALVDATFYSAGELGGRPPVAHPPVTRTLALSRRLSTRLVMTHLNHTNPLLDEDGPERAALAAAGLQVAYTGQIIHL